VCNNCIDNSFVFDRLIATFDYGFPLNNLLHELKYKRRLNYSQFISGIFYRRLCSQITHLPHAIIPVPLHKDRHNERGFNQTHEIIREFTTKHPQVRIIQAYRAKATQQQAKLNRYARIVNMHNAFSIPMRLDNLDVAIIDDVVTTGTTINELARLCKQLGANKVEVWCLLRAQN
jgi:ComF family protein